MRFFLVLLMIFGGVCGSAAQAVADVQKIIETEKAFAKTAETTNTKAAFLEYMADDGIIFNPGPINGKELWNKRAVAPSKLLWAPEFADISSNGAFGYTTGPWEFRPKGMEDIPAGFGHFVTIWQRQPNGNYRAVLDIGISHEKADLKVECKFPTDTGKELNEKRISAADSSTVFFETAEKQGLIKAYKALAAEDIRLYREGKFPLLGKKAALGALVKDKTKIQFYRRSVFVSAADMAYISNGYSVFDEAGKKQLEKGNFVQIWKLRKGKWRIVLDLFSPLPPDQK